MLPDRLQLPMYFDPVRLEADLDALAAIDWTRHFVSQNFEGDWSAIPLRHPVGETHPIRQIYSDPTATAFVASPMLAASPYFREVLSAFDCPLRSVRLMRLTAGSVIKEHSDGDLDAEHEVLRLHIPIRTNPDVEFEVNRRRVVMAPGTLWYLRLSDPHRVANRGATDRVHLVIDVDVNDWLLVQLRQAMAEAA